MLDVLNGVIEATPIPPPASAEYQAIDFCQFIYFGGDDLHQKQPKKGDKIEVDHKCLFLIEDE